MAEKLTPYLCDLCQFRRSKDDSAKDGFKCNTDKRRSVHYKGCDSFKQAGQETASKPVKKKVRKNG